MRADHLRQTLESFVLSDTRAGADLYCDADAVEIGMHELGHVMAWSPESRKAWLANGAFTTGQLGRALAIGHLVYPGVTSELADDWNEIRANAICLETVRILTPEILPVVETGAYGNVAGNVSQKRREKAIEMVKASQTTRRTKRLARVLARFLVEKSKTLDPPLST